MQPSLNGFALVGGSALALVLHHRVSDDLIMAWVGERLPRPQLDQLATAVRAAGSAWEPPDVASVEPTAADHRQNYLAGKTVRVTFFTPDESLARLLFPAQPRAPLRVATLRELFAVTALLTLGRPRLRDWFDLHVLVRDHGFTLADYQDAFVRAGLGSEASAGALAAFCDRPPSAGDPGFTSLIPDAPTAEGLQEFFRAARAGLACDQPVFRPATEKPL